jgi:hypothetical protein
MYFGNCIIFLESYLSIMCESDWRGEWTVKDAMRIKGVSVEMMSDKNRMEEENVLYWPHSVDKDKEMVSSPVF